MTSVTIRDSALYVRNMTTRIPFEYGITRLTALPHLFVCVQMEVDGRQGWGVAADGLAPKWFTKEPDQTFEREVEQMGDVISSAAERACAMNPVPDLFTCWWELYQQQMAWGRRREYPDLLVNFGVSLVERAMIDAFCRLKEVPFHRALRQNLFWIDPGRVHQELAGTVPSDWLPESPSNTLHIRHTVGLGDPLTEEDVQPRNRPDDGLPVTLEEHIRRYGVKYFKIKAHHDREEARNRLRSIAEIVTNHLDTFAFSLDGNEVFDDLSEFRKQWAYLTEDDTIRSFIQEGLLFVEQPVKRGATNSDAGLDPLDWPDRPPLIIDESDSSVEALPEALERGYHGTSHKNCKGVFKGILNRCLVARKNENQKGAPYLMSAEDLSNVGPVALLQDLAVISVLGLDHAERNGHHYFPGLRMMPEDIQQDMLEEHRALYRAHSSNGASFPSLNIDRGRIRLDDVNRAPFGYRIDLDPSRFTPLSDWSFDTLGLGDC